MKDTWIEPASGVWVVEGRSPRIEYSLRAMEEICASAMEGLQKLSRGGIEVGGVLYGEHTDGILRILAWRPIPCEHGRGPGFLLSESDVESLKTLLHGSDPALQGYTPLGWFVSHTRSEISLRKEDREIYDQFFVAPWQVTLVLRPARFRGTEAGFFFREAGGVIQTASSLKTFGVAAFAKLSTTQERTAPRPRRTGPPATPVPTSFAHSPETALADATAPLEAPPRRLSRTGLLLGIWGVFTAALLGVLVYLLCFADRTPQIGFRATDQDGQIHINWDHNASRIRHAERAVLEITDGGPKFELDIDPEMLRSGGYVYTRKSDDVNLRLILYQDKSAPFSEGTRFLGQPTSRVLTHEISVLIAERTKLRAQYADLEQKLDNENTRNRQLQTQNRILQQQLDLLKAATASK